MRMDMAVLLFGSQTFAGSDRDQLISRPALAVFEKEDLRKEYGPDYNCGKYLLPSGAIDACGVPSQKEKGNMASAKRIAGAVAFGAAQLIGLQTSYADPTPGKACH